MPSVPDDILTATNELIATHAIAIDVAQEIDEQAWLEQRRNGIGGSDAGTLLGLNPWSGRFELWLNKTRQIPDLDLSDREAIYWGHRLESMVCEEFTTRTGITTWKPQVMYQSRERPWQQISLDSLGWDDVLGEPILFEAKTCSEYLANEWADDQVPPWYEAQCYHAAAVTGIRQVWIGCLIGGQRFVHRRIDIDEKILADLCAAEESFWTVNVLGGVQPDPDATASCTDLLRDMWEAIEGQVELPAEAVDIALAYLDANASMNELKDRKAELANQLRNMIAENTVGVYNGLVLATNKEVTSKVFDQDRFKEEFPALYRTYMTERKSRRLYVPKPK